MISYFKRETTFWTSELPLKLTEARKNTKKIWIDSPRGTFTGINSDKNGYLEKTHVGVQLRINFLCFYVNLHVWKFRSWRLLRFKVIKDKRTCFTKKYIRQVCDIHVCKYKHKLISNINIMFNIRLKFYRWYGLR